MKTLAIASIALAANLAVCAESLTVYGYGTDRESAKKDAFRTAIENVCGAKIVSQRENFNDQNIVNEVLVHSTCRVIAYSIIEENKNPYYLKMNVQLHDTKVDNRIYSEANEGFRFQGELKEHIDGYYEEKQSSDKLLDLMFKNYPYKAYTVTNTKKPYITDDQYRNLYLIIPFQLKWNYEFIEGMRDTFSSIENRYGNNVITVMAKNPDSFILGKKTKYYLNDFQSLEHIKSKFTGENELRIRVSARDNKGKKILNLCYSPEYKMGGIFYSVGINDELTIFGNDHNEGSIQVKLSVPAEVIYDLTVDVAAERDCRLYTPPL